MKPLHARYPFMAAAREAVEEAGVDLLAIVSEDDPALERGRERVESAITDRSVGEAARSPRTELLSYPVARVLVSAVDEAVLTRRYARAEAETAHERFRAEFEAEQLKSARTEQLDLDAVLREFDLAGAVRTVEDGYRMAVAPYLTYAADQSGDEWRLVNRALADGEVPLSRPELLVLLQSAVETRVREGLPLSVPDAIAEAVETEAEGIRETLSELDLTREIDTVVPDLFPPCMQALLDQVQRGEHLEHHSRFAIASFLTSIGMTTDEIVDLFEVNPGFGEEATRYQVDHIRGDTSPTEYSAPSCATMQSYGDCVNKDDLCERIKHPMAYYEAKLDDAEEDELVDWREGDEESEA